jgi:predicted CXXCH cytochrome family protein
LIAVAAAIVVLAIAALIFEWTRARPSPGSEASKSVPAAYVGRKVCGECHAKELEAWRGSDHDLAMQVADDKTVLGNFANAKFRYSGITTTFSRRDGKFYVTTDGSDGKLHDYQIKYTFGVHPLQQYLIELPGGRMQALGIAWDSRPRALGGERWFHLYPKLDLKAGDPLHWTGNSQTWNFQCAECHSTDLKKNYDAKTNTYHTTWAELDVSCEACHGPGANHVAWAKKTGDAANDPKHGLVVALDERKGVTWARDATGTPQRSAPRTQSREIDACARCHGRAARLSDDDPHGKPPLDTHRYALLDDGLYWDDGQMHDEVYNWGAFLQSKMYAKGVTCSDCHDPHSLKLKAPGNAVCTQCHDAAKYDVGTHTHHRAGTAGAACAACHMPTTTYMIVDPRHDHSMRVPRPDLSVRLNVPNACNNCHANKSAQWAADAVSTLWGKGSGGYQQFANAFAAAAGGLPEARGSLLGLIDDKEQPALVRASALTRLAPYQNAATLPSVTRSLNDTDPLVRLAAVQVLSVTDVAIRQRYLPRMLDDPVLAIRIETAHALAGPAEAGLKASERATLDRVLAEYIAVHTYNSDRPEGRTSLANLYAIRGDAEHAITEYRKAIELDPTFVQAYVNLADLFRERGVESAAEAALRAGLSRNPKSAPLHYALGLSLVRQKRTAEGLKSLAEAARLDAGSPRYAYVYAVALSDSGRPRDALRILEATHRKNPYDRDVLSTLALYTSQAGRRDAALAYARDLVKLDPDNRQYANLLQQIEVAPKR